MSHAVDSARVFIDSGRPDQAISVLRAEIAVHPDHAEAHLVHTVANLQLHQWDEAERHARAALHDSFYRPQALHLLGRALSAQPERVGESIAALNEAVALEPTNTRFRVTLANCLLKAGLRQQAVATADQAVQSATDSDERALALMQRAAARTSVHDRAGARADAEAAVAQDPTSLAMQEALVRIQYLTGKRTAAMGTALGVLRQTPMAKAPAAIARAALYLLGYGTLLALLVTSFLTPLITFSTTALSDASGEAEVALVTRLGAALGLVLMGLVLWWRLGVLRNPSVRAAVLHFGRKSALSWFAAVAVALMALCYLGALIGGHVTFFLVPMPLLIMLPSWYFYGTAANFLKYDAA